jgi:hypothetical protein
MLSLCDIEPTAFAAAFAAALPGGNVIRLT